MTQATIPAPAAPRRFDFAGFWRKYPFAFALALTIVMLAITIIAQPNFAPVQQISTWAPYAMAGIALMPAIISGRGGIDLTVSPVMTLTGILFIGYLAPAGLASIVAVPILLALGFVIGLVNGLLIVLLRLPAVVVTLAMMFVYSGLNVLLAPSPLTISGNWITALSGDWGGFFPAALVALAIPFVAWILLARSAWGRSLYAAGGNDATAFSAGVNVAFLRISAFVLGSMFAVWGGLVLVSLTSSANASTSASLVTTSIASVALGGISLAGGRGGILGALCGSAVIYLVQRILSTFQVPTMWLNLVYGLLLIVAVVLGAILASPRTKR